MFDSLRVGSYRNGKEIGTVMWLFLVTNHFSIMRLKGSWLSSRACTFLWSEIVFKSILNCIIWNGRRVVVSWLICWSAADFLLLLHTTTIRTLTEMVKISCISWIKWQSCWRHESAGMWHCVIGWVFPSILKDQVTKSHSITSVKTWIWILSSYSLRSYIPVAGTLFVFQCSRTWLLVICFSELWCVQKSYIA